MLVTDNNKAAIERAIEEVYEECFKSKGIILTEDDLKCRLYHCLIQKPEFSGTRPANDAGIHASLMHAEVSWFDATRRLTIKPDLTILEPEGLSILYTVGSLRPPPSKQFSFTGSALIFELKFVRNPKGVTVRELRKIQDDFDKVGLLFQRLQKIGNDIDTFCYFVVFSKYSDMCPEFDSFLQHHKHSQYWKLIYKTIDVERPEGFFHRQ